MTAVQLNFVNRSQDTGSSNVVIFQKNEAATDELAVAWKVIEKCKPGDNHLFGFSLDTYIAASDSYDNYTPQLQAQAGQQFTMKQTRSGDTLVYTGGASGGQTIELVNALPRGAINGNIYRDGKCLATFTDLAPGQKALFGFKTGIWIGVVPAVLEGHILNAALLSHVNNEISLVNILKADIIMTGAGPGTPAAPYVFELANVVYA